MSDLFDPEPTRAAPPSSADAQSRPYRQFTLPAKHVGLLWPKQTTFSAPTPPSEPDNLDADEAAAAVYADQLAAYEAELDSHPEGSCWHDLQFRMVELTSREQDKAAKLAGDSKSKLTRELIFASLYRVGDWPTNGNRRKLEAWYKAIGPRCQRLVEAAFVALNSVEEEDVASFLDEALVGLG